MVVYLLIFISAALTIFHIATRYSRKGRLLLKIPGPKPYPIIGNILLVNVQVKEFWDLGRKICKEFYPITRMWSFTTAIVQIMHPDDLEVLLSSQKAIEKGYMYGYLHPWLRTGLLTSTGEKWRQRRKILTPVFHFSILKQYLAIINEQGQKVINSLKSEKKVAVKELVPFSCKYTLNVICESALGVKLDEMDSELVNKYTKAIHDFGNIVVYRVCRPYIATWMLPYIYEIGKTFQNSLKILDLFTDKVIRERKEYHKSTQDKYLTDISAEIEGKTSNHEVNIGQKRRLAMLDHLLQEQKNGRIDDNGIKEEVDTFTFEGHDTTGMGLTFTLALLAENKWAQDRVRAEVSDILDRNEGKLSMSDIQEMPYLEQCIKESLRLYPPVATLQRYVAEDLQLKNALIPADTHLMIHFFDTHRDSNFWQDPEKFDPDRFLPENSKNRHPFAYVPFSAGPRNCIGQKFAMMEMKSFIARVLHDFYLEPIDRLADLKLLADIVLRPAHPISIKLNRINK